MNNYPAELTREHKRFLKDLFPGDAFADSPEILGVFGADSSRRSARPFCVVRPESTEQVATLLEWADRERMPIYPRCRGTSMVGGCVPVHGGVVVSFLRMNRILDISEDDFTAIVEPGVVTADLKASAREQGLYYPPDPASYRVSTIGGNIMTCAGGMSAVKYGVTRDWVLGLEVVLPGGKVIRTGGSCQKDVVGLDLTRLMVGSSGSLGLVTKAWVKLIPHPEETASVLAGYQDEDTALEAARAVYKAGILPTAMEFLDRVAMGAVSNISDAQWLTRCKGALLIRVDGASSIIGLELSRLEKALSTTAPIYLTKGRREEEEALWEVRRQISPASFTLAPDKLGEDIAVPRGAVGQALKGIRAISDELKFVMLCFGHLGDGNIHVNFMHDSSDATSLNKALEARKRVFKLTLELGGTVSGEHGIGITKQDVAGEQLDSDRLMIMSGIKHVYDPKEIMNPGKGW